MAFSRLLDGQYPWFPDEKSLTQAVLSEVHISSPDGNDLYALSQFVMEYHRLKLGSDLLPGILELYQWLHTELAYAVTYEDATKITLGRLAKVVAKRMPGRGDSSTQYESLKGKTKPLGQRCLCVLCTLDVEATYVCTCVIVS